MTPASAIRQMASVLRPGGKLLVREPRGHCPKVLFQTELAWADEAGLIRQPTPRAWRSWTQAALFQK
jgi:hypothetical protein